MPVSLNASFGSNGIGSRIFMSSKDSSFGFSSVVSAGAMSSRSGSGGVITGREFVRRSRIILRSALQDSKKTTQRHLERSPPRLRAVISQRSSVYCTTLRTVATFSYIVDDSAQNVVYRA